MKIWTIQHVKVWEILQRRNIFYARKSCVDSFWLREYDWMRQKMKKFIDFDARDNMWPIWGWVQWDSRKKLMPDLRYSNHLPRGTHGVRLCLDLPVEKVLMSDFDTWHEVLNVDSLKEKDFWRTGFNARIDKDWENRVLYTKHARRLPDTPVQATFWYISADDIKSITNFIAV